MKSQTRSARRSQHRLDSAAKRMLHIAGLAVLALSVPAAAQVRSSPPPSPPAAFQRGDSKADGTVNIGDAVHILSFLFTGQAAPSCLKAADVNDDGIVDIADPIAALGALFLGGPPPARPFPDCGFDLTADALTCSSSPACP